METRARARKKQCITQQRWAEPGELADKIEGAFRDRHLSVRQLLRKMSAWVKKHAVPMRAVGGDAVKVGDTSVPRRAVAPNGTSIELGAKLASGTYGVVMQCTFSGKPTRKGAKAARTKASQAALMKLARKYSSTFDAEIMVQSVIRCSVQDAFQRAGLPNPVPRVLAVLQYPRLKRGHDTALVMEFAGTPFYELLEGQLAANERDLFQTVALLARSLQVMQRSVGFIHNDLHPANVLVRPAARPYPFKGGAVHFQADNDVAIIDYGFACVSMNRSDVRVLEPQDVNQACSLRNYATDLFQFLGRCMMEVNAGTSTPRFAKFVTSVLSAAVPKTERYYHQKARDTLNMPPLKTWGPKQVDQLYDWAVWARGTTPANVLQALRPYLRS